MQDNSCETEAAVGRIACAFISSLQSQHWLNSGSTAAETHKHVRLELRHVGFRMIWGSAEDVTAVRGHHEDSNGVRALSGLLLHRTLDHGHQHGLLVRDGRAEAPGSMQKIRQ